MLREGVILSGEKRIRKELTELSLQKEAEFNPREETVGIKEPYSPRG